MTKQKFNMDSFIQSYKTMIDETQILSEEVLMEDRIDFLKSKYPVVNSQHDSFAEHRQSDKIIDFLAEKADPTKKKVYMPWLVKNYHQGQFRQEDAPRLADTLSNFDKYKHKLPENQRDIGRYKKISEVRDAIEPHIGTAATNKEAIQTLKDNSDIPGHELKYEDDKIKVYHLSTEDASRKMYASKSAKTPGAFPAEWCTAWGDGRQCQFDNYRKTGDLNVVHRKSDGEIFQYHTDGQFMDRKDDTISDKDFDSFKDSLHTAWDKVPELLHGFKRD